MWTLVCKAVLRHAANVERYTALNVFHSASVINIQDLHQCSGAATVDTYIGAGTYIGTVKSGISTQQP